MKLFLSLILSSYFLLSESTKAQTQKGAWEFSVSGTVGSLVTAAVVQSQQFGTQKFESDPMAYAALAFRPGYYIVNGLAIEPEFQWYALARQSPRFPLSGNLSYNLFFPNSRVIPFLLAGYGVSNSGPVLVPGVRFKVSDEMNVHVLNLGAGAKLFVGENVAFRSEYRFQRFSHTQEFSFPQLSSTTNTVYQYHNLLVGISVFVFRTPSDE